MRYFLGVLSFGFGVYSMLMSMLHFDGLLGVLALCLLLIGCYLVVRSITE